MKFFRKIKNLFVNAFFPSICPYCGKVITKGSYACKQCAEKLPETSYKRYAVGGWICSAPFPYEDCFAKAVKRLKFNNRGDYAKPLAFQIVHSILEIIDDKSFDIVTSVPMHKTDKKERGYNQAELLARECAEIMGLPYIDTLVKIKRNTPQHKTKGKDRGKNVRGVFLVTDKTLVEGKHILLIDDIITTGHTLGECAAMLNRAGCKTISCAVVCTTIS